MTETLHHNSANDKNLNCVGDENKARWFRTSVEIFEHPTLNFGPYDRRSAWQWLIANAAWKTREINHKGVATVLQRGQVIIGRAFLAKTWGWTEQKVRTFVHRLCEDGMLEINQSNGHFANIATICNYDKYQTPQPERGRSDNQSATSQQPEPNQTFTRNTNTTNKKTNTPAREERQSGKDYWANAMSAPPSPETHSHVGVTMQDGEITLHNGTRAMWLEQFGGDAKRLQLALKQAAGFVQPNSGRPLEAQVGAQLARIVGQKIDSDKRYEKAKSSSSKTYQPDFRSQLEAI